MVVFFQPSSVFTRVSIPTEAVLEAIPKEHQPVMKVNKGHQIFTLGGWID